VCVLNIEFYRKDIPLCVNGEWHNFSVIHRYEKQAQQDQDESYFYLCHKCGSAVVINIDDYFRSEKK